MKPQTRQRFNKFKERMAEINGVSAEEVGTAKFSVAPSVQQKLVTRLQEDDEFLGAINIVPVDEQSGQKLGLGIGGTIAGRTNTAGGTARTGVDPSTLDDDEYKCVKTNFDTKLRYDKLDMWAKFPNFQPLIQGQIVIRQGLDRIMIGFNGVTAAAQTDRTANPLLQDVNVGWLQKMRLNAPAQVMGEVADGKVAGKVTYGTDGDFASIDAMVYGAKEKLLPVYARRAPAFA
jgi:P2 family phage major capsid protein